MKQFIVKYKIGIIIISIMLIIANSMGLLSFIFLNLGSNKDNIDDKFFFLFVNYFPYLCISLITIGIVGLLSVFFITKTNLIKQS